MLFCQWRSDWIMRRETHFFIDLFYTLLHNCKITVLRKLMCKYSCHINPLYQPFQPYILFTLILKTLYFIHEWTFLKRKCIEEFFGQVYDNEKLWVIASPFRGPTYKCNRARWRDSQTTCCTRWWGIDATSESQLKIWWGLRCPLLQKLVH